MKLSSVLLSLSYVGYVSAYASAAIGNTEDSAKSYSDMVDGVFPEFLEAKDDKRGVLIGFALSSILTIHDFLMFQLQANQGEHVRTCSAQGLPASSPSTDRQ